MSQTSIPAALALGIAGACYDMSAYITTTGFQAEASAEMPFGIMVAKGTGDRDIILPAASTAKLVGLLMHDHSIAGSYLMGTSGVKPKTPVSVARRGRFWVVAEENVTAYTDRAYIRYASGAGGSQKGAWRKSAVSNETIDATMWAQFITSATAGNLAVVEFDMTGL